MKVLAKLIFFVIAAVTLQAVEIGGEVENRLKISDKGSSRVETNAKIDFKMKGEGFYSQISLVGNYTTEGTIDIDRAYTELYIDKTTVSVGRQRISWGTGYLFNYADAFNEPDPKDPKGEKKGVDSLKIRYDVNETSRIESVAVYNIFEDIDYAVRSSATLGKFEIMGNYIKVAPAKLNRLIPTGKIENEYYIVEARGEYEAGIWGSIVYKKNNLDKVPQFISKDISKDERIGVLGSDYTIALGEAGDVALYLLAEYSHNITTEEKYLYTQGKLTVFSDINITEGIVYDTSNNGRILMTSVNYSYNDYISIAAGYNKYLNSNESPFIRAAGSGNEGYVSLKTNF